MSNPKHDQFVGCRINNEIDEVSIARNDELSHTARQLPPAEFREMRRYFKRAQDCRSHPRRSVGDRMIAVVVCLNQRCKDFEAVAFRRARLRLIFEIRSYLAKRPFIISFAAEGANVHHHTVSGSILSYSW
jgi:hypothetical protein